MEEFALIIPILASILSVVAGVMNKKKKEQKSARQDAAYHPGENTAHSDSQARPAFAGKPAAPAFPAPARMSGEGRDDCHAYMLDDIAPASADDEKTDEERQRVANELLRGVIISEILQRPRLGYGRRRA